MGDFLEEPAGFQPGWGEGDELNAADFVGARDPRDDFEELVGSETTGALMGGRGLQQMREDLFPLFFCNPSAKPQKPARS